MIIDTFFEKSLSQSDKVKTLVNVMERTMLLWGGVLTLLTALVLYLSRENPWYLPFFLLGFFVIVLFTLYTQSPIALAMLSVLTALTLTLRIPYLPWGDAWQDYAMVLRTQLIGYPDFWLPHEEILQALISQPLMPALLAFISSITFSDPMLVQKVIVPLIGATAPIILFKFGSENIQKSGAYVGAILFLICTPFLHWLVQPVRETLAIPLLFLALWISYTSIQSSKNFFLFVIAIISIVLLPPLHTLSPLLFLVSWFGISISIITLASGDEERWRKTIQCWIISIVSYLSLSLWVMFFNPPYMKSTVGQITLLIPPISNFPLRLIIIFFLLISISYLFLYLITRNKPFILKLESIITLNRDRMITVLRGLCYISLIAGIIFISGFSQFKTSYPLPMLISSIVIMILALRGLPWILTKTNFHLFCWTSALGIFFIIGIWRPALVVDPLRILSYLFAPLCLMAGAGYSSLIQNTISWSHLPRVGSLSLALICTISLIFTFPAPIFLGFYPQPDHILYDERQYTIAHPEEEIEGIKWLSENHKKGTIYTDTNIYYATLWITQDGSITAKKLPDRLNPMQFNPDENSYVLISDRMFITAKFGEWLYGKSKPLSLSEYQQVESNTTRIFKKGGFEIFLRPSQIR